MATASLVLDISLLAASIWMIVVVRGLGGVVGRTLNIITVGAVVLGLAHISESVIFDRVLGWPVDLVEFLHRVMVFVGFVLIVFGFRQIRQLK